MSEFGGAWSEKKLDTVSGYLEAYTTALKNQGFNLVYIDTFCGDGSQRVKGRKTDNGQMVIFEEAQKFMRGIRGSAQRAVELPLPFDRYHFVDKSRKSLTELRERLTALKPELADRMNWHAGDVNAQLPKILRPLKPKNERAVLFADPFGMQMDWATIQAVAATGIVDFWYLVPTGLAMNRLATNSGDIPEAWEERLDRFMGETEWRTRWYVRTQGNDLFGRIENIEKVADIKLMEEDFQARLRTAFPFVAKNKMQLKDGGRVLFTLMFACSNPDPKAFGLASKIANHLLKG